MLLNNCGIYAANAAGLGIADTGKIIDISVRMVSEMMGEDKVEGLKVAGKGRAVSLDELIEMTNGQIL